MANEPKTPPVRQMAQDGYRPQAKSEQVFTKGYKPNPQGGYVAPTQSPTNNVDRPGRISVSLIRR